ncbi:MAG: lipopolysaccharide kinase InaA family protein [Arcobacteraceae bacterium]
MIYKINTLFEAFEPFVKDIQTYFKQNHQTIHKARNELKVIDFNHTQVVVKSFKIPHFINRVVYTFFKDSKARKSYEYALKIGKFTPNPIAYVEFFSLGLLAQSYFIAQKFDYDFTIREPLLDNEFKDKEAILKAFAQFTYELHAANIFHHDYSPGNILIKKEGENYIFKIVDINRMQFFSLTLEQRLKNFAKLWAKDEDLIIIVQEYASLIHKDEKKCVKMALDFSHKHKAKINLKKRLKGIEVVD